MAINPTKINPNLNTDYANMYQDNFIKQNDPVALGNAASVRQMSSGITNKMEPGIGTAGGDGTLVRGTGGTGQINYGARSNTKTAGATDYYNTASQCPAGQTFYQGVCVNTAFLQQRDYSATNQTSATQNAGYSQVTPNSYVGDFGATQNAGYSQGGPVGNVSATQGAGYSRITPDTYVGSLSATQQAGYSQYDPTKATGSLSATQSAGYSQYDPTKAVKSLSETKGAGYSTYAGQGTVQNAPTHLTSVTQQAGYSQVTPDTFVGELSATKGAGYSTYAGQGTVQDAPTYSPSIMQQAGYSMVTPDTFVGDFGATQNAGYTTYAGQGIVQDAPATNAPDMPTNTSLTGGDTKYDTTEPEDPATVIKDVTAGTKTPEQAIDVFKQNAMATLEQNYQDRFDQIDNLYSQSYSQLINYLDQKYRISDTGGFTGGIEQQIQQKASAAELQQINSLLQNRQNELSALEAEKATYEQQAYDLAKQQYNDQLALAGGSIAGLAQSVMDGSRTLDEVIASADELGLGDIKNYILTSAATSLGQYADPNTGAIPTAALDSLTAQLTDAGFSQEEIDGVFVTYNLDNTDIAQTEAFTEFDGVLAEAGTTDGLGGAIAAGVTTAGVASATLFTLGAANVWNPVGWGLLIAGAAVAVGSAAVGAYTYNLTNTSQDEVNSLVNYTTQALGNIDYNALVSGTSDITISETPQTQNTVPGNGTLNDGYTVTVGGQQKTLTGADVLTLVTMLQQSNVLDSYPELKALGENIFNSNSLSFSGTNQYDNAYKLYQQIFNK